MRTKAYLTFIVLLLGIVFLNKLIMACLLDANPVHINAYGNIVSLVLIVPRVKGDNIFDLTGKEITLGKYFYRTLVWLTGVAVVGDLWLYLYFM